MTLQKQDFKSPTGASPLSHTAGECWWIPSSILNNGTFLSSSGWHHSGRRVWWGLKGAKKLKVCFNLMDLFPTFLHVCYSSKDPSVFILWDPSVRILCHNLKSLMCTQYTHNHITQSPLVHASTASCRESQRTEEVSKIMCMECLAWLMREILMAPSLKQELNLYGHQLLGILWSKSSPYTVQ